MMVYNIYKPPPPKKTNFSKKKKTIVFMKIKQKYQKDSFPGLNEFGDLLAYHN